MLIWREPVHDFTRNSRTQIKLFENTVGIYSLDYFELNTLRIGSLTKMTGCLDVSVVTGKLYFLSFEN